MTASQQPGPLQPGPQGQAEPPPDGTPAGWAARGEALTAARAYEGAADAWRQAVAASGMHEGAETRAARWLGLGEALREIARWAEAADAFRQAAALAPRLAPAWAGLAVALVNLGDAGQGLAAARTALEIDGMLPAGHRAAAIALLRAGRLDEAEAACRAALDRDPRYPEGIATLALVRMMQNRPDEAEALFREATDAKPTLAEAIGNHAALLARLGRTEDAKREAARAIRLKPFLPAPFHLLGTLLRGEGLFAEAGAAFARVLAMVPDHPDARINLADCLRRGGKPADAAAICRAGLAGRPEDAGLLIALGAALQDLGDPDGALAAYERVPARHPARAEAENDMARLHQRAGRLDRALDHLRRAAAARPQDAGIARNLSAALLDAGFAGEAEEAARAAVRVAPADPAAHRQLAHALSRQGRFAEAADAVGAALRTAPQDGDAWIQAAALLIRAGERTRAVPHCRQAIRLKPEDGRGWALFSQALRGLRLTAPDPDLRADLLKAMGQPGAEHAYLVEAAVSAVMLEPAMTALAEAAGREAAGEDGAVAALLSRAAVARELADDRLLIALLETTVVADAALETALTALRRALLGLAGEEGVTVLHHPAWPPLVCALARQCFLNEYAFAETAQEGVAVQALDRSLRETIARRDVPHPARLALFAAYRPLAGWAGTEAVLTHETWPEAVRRLLALQIEEPRAEAALAAATPRLTPVDEDPVTRAVRAQYEASPYPRWIDAGLLDSAVPAKQLLRSLLPHVALADGPDWTAPDVLVAGCGTGRESVWAANQIAGARVLAVDLSLTSLGYARRQTERLGVGPVEYAQADLMRLGGLERRFDIIQCVGVLHHLADPLAGWRVLTGLLKPGGVMKVGLYSEKARRTVVLVRDFIAARGYADTPADIRRFRQDVLALPADDPVRAIALSPDFYNVSACRDLVFHVQEHRLTLPRIAGWIEALGLEFLGFQLEDPAAAQLYRNRFPEDPDMVSLARWDRFEDENPGVFSNLYQFWVRRP